MANETVTITPRRGKRKQRSTSVLVLRWLAIIYLFFLVAWPVALVYVNMLADGLDPIIATFQSPAVVNALQLTFWAAVWAVIINTVFGVSISILLVRYEFPGKRVLNALIDLPLSVSPVIVGLAIILVFNGRDGWFGVGLEDAGFQVLFAFPSIVLATAFVSMPLVIREVVPVLKEVGTEQEQAAKSLGAGPVATFRRITLPAIKWGVIYGVVLCLARSIGEFGAVKVVSGNVINRTQTATLTVEQFYHDFQSSSAYTIAALLASVAIVVIIIVSALRARAERLH